MFLWHLFLLCAFIFLGRPEARLCERTRTLQLEKQCRGVERHCARTLLHSHTLTHALTHTHTLLGAHTHSSERRRTKVRFCAFFSSTAEERKVSRKRGRGAECCSVRARRDTLFWVLNSCFGNNPPVSASDFWFFLYLYARFTRVLRTSRGSLSPVSLCTQRPQGFVLISRETEQEDNLDQGGPKGAKNSPGRRSWSDME